MNTVRRMEVIAFDAKTGIVSLQALQEDGGGYAKARFLSKMPLSPDGSGGAEYIYPAIGSKVLVQSLGDQHFILGFYQLPGIGSKHYTSMAADVDEQDSTGGYRLETGNSNYLSLLLNGMIKIFAHPFAKLHISQSLKHIIADFKSIFVNSGGGKLKWTTDDSNKSNFTFEVHKLFDPYTDSELQFGEILERDSKFPKYSDKFIIRSRAEDSHVIEIETRQAIDSNIPNTQVLTKYGRDALGNHIHVYVQDKDGNQSHDITLGEDFLHKRQFTTTDGAYVQEIINKDGSLVLNVNDKANIRITSDGEIYISSQTQLVHIGGETDGVGLLTEAFLPIFYGHVHAGNLGVTTSPAMYPVFPTPAQTAPEIISTEQNKTSKQASDTNIYTVRTKGS